ncbi:MAG: histidine phosphatase family protein [Dissulfurimicrobium sp.]|uniref:histidine phosphatase family protein n=1 Tax=Dissulfurimicrobium TaxID=1769732 RepID=UPI001EDA178A|nr:histidine phosphatase family protein [Dissulfurimicrobium hydrothermale]UKL14270.1 histidine phosphatase family protein [Dissulfurimicrobium hydrothermale]
MSCSEATRIILLRHGEVDAAKAVFYSQMDVPLSERGKKSSLTVSRVLEPVPISWVLSSDLSRCLFLARAIAAARGVGVEARRELRELDFGLWTGLGWDEIEMRFPGAIKKRMSNLESYRPPMGESVGDLAERAWGLIQQVVSEYHGRIVAVVSHGGVNRVIIAKAVGLPLQNIFSIHQDFSCINVIDFFSDGLAVVRALNWLPGVSEGFYP